ncbi:hypothetical protein BCR35DRAFT_350376 [Leucosporidium creatinivorum]|uniref:Peroxisomal biogenesis factor 11 n=1 Tax=Leucosporidium creatinivorum TaxID=106004 RepID=A0A1Y2G341_9BASI|nr:hypothetical protein BCR35DRAFT_350376 [Leucosporidium creatinivorum]
MKSKRERRSTPLLPTCRCSWDFKMTTSHATASTSTYPLPSSSAHAHARTNSVTKYVHAQEPLFQKRTPLGFLSTADGREAGLRIAQYALRLTLYIRTRYLSAPILSRLLALVSALSAFRRLVALYDLSTIFYNSCSPIKLFNPFSWNRKPDIKGKGRADGARSRPWRVDDLLRLSRAALDVASIFADNTFLFARMSLLPLSKRSARKADRIADYATLLSSLLGLAQVAHSRSQVWAEGRAVRKGAIALEQRLEDFEFWVKGDGDEASLQGEKDEKEREERRLKDKIRSERRKLKRLREELNGLWWERLRLAAEGIFATYDVLELDTGSEGVKALSGFASASIMASQAWQEYAPPPPRR